MTGRPVARAIVWQDRRSAHLCDELRAKGMEPFFQENTGLLLDPYFSGTKADSSVRAGGARRNSSAVGRISTQATIPIVAIATRQS